MQSCRKSGELYQSCPILQSDTCQYSGSSDKEAHLFYLECESQHRLLGKIKNAAISALIRLRFVNTRVCAKTLPVLFIWKTQSDRSTFSKFAFEAQISAEHLH